MKQFECPYLDECGLLCDQTNENCRIKELFEDFYKVKKLYFEANAKCEQLEQENEELKQRNARATMRFLDDYYELRDCLDKIKEIIRSRSQTNKGTAILNTIEKAEENIEFTRSNKEANE